MEIYKGDIIQISNGENKWFPYLLIVDEVKSWGVQAFAFIPSVDGKTGVAHYRVSNGEFIKVGSAEFLVAQI